MTLFSEVIAIGDEITSGQRLDTNTQWLSKRLGDVGVSTLFHSTVGDDFQASVRVFREAIDRADIVVMTGGLGPTQDDLTHRALAEATGRKIEVRPEAIEHIESLFARRGREMPERNRLQAEFPEGSLIVPNPQGSAPGIDLTVERAGRSPSRVFCLPGVPAEMKQMWEQTVRTRLDGQLGTGRHVVHSVVKCFGVGESDMELKIPELIQRDHVPRVGITVNRATISLRISAEADSHDECLSQIESVKTLLRERIGALIYGEGDQYELEHAVCDALEARGETLCCLEVGFNSLADTWMSALERPDVYRGGLSITEGSNAAKWCETLGVADSCDTQRLAIALLDIFESDWTMAIDGYPTLDASDGKPLPSSDVFLIVAGRSIDRPRRLKIHLGGHPDVLPSRIAKSGLDFLRKVLSKST